MKHQRINLIVILLVSLSGLAAAAGAATAVPGPTDYAAFSRFITERNIFNPNRHPQSAPHHEPPPVHVAAAPTFELVGTMSYAKGIFAFFNGNRDDLQQALTVSGKIADYTVTRVHYGRVTLETTNKTAEVQLKVGDAMREINGAWQLASPGTVSLNSSPATNHANANPSTAIESSGGAPTPSQAQAILERLKEQREKQIK